jgi:hypothetical protein
MTPSDDVMTAAIDYFYDEHSGCLKDDPLNSP